MPFFEGRSYILKVKLSLAPETRFIVLGAAHNPHSTDSELVLICSSQKHTFHSCHGLPERG